MKKNNWWEERQGNFNHFEPAIKTFEDCKAQRDKELSEQQEKHEKIVKELKEEIDKWQTDVSWFNDLRAKNANEIREIKKELQVLKECQSVCATYKSENESIVKSECPLFDQIEELKIENTQLHASASYKLLKEKELEIEQLKDDLKRIKQMTPTRSIELLEEIELLKIDLLNEKEMAKEQSKEFAKQFYPPDKAYQEGYEAAEEKYRG